jgi:ribosomal protein S18 acetylase RimI-like enzyme
MENIIIHPANESERDLAAALLAGSEPWITLGITARQCEKTCHDPEYLVYIAYLGDEPAGTVILDPRGLAGSPYLKSIAVYPKFRGRGVGSSILSFSEDLFRSESKHFFLCVSSFNQGARKFYERHGYKVIGELKDYIIEGASEILMYKHL